MNLHQGLLVCESMLARLDAAFAIADAETECTRAAEQRMRRLVSRLQVEQQPRNWQSRVFTRPETHVTLPLHTYRPANENLMDQTQARA